MLVFSSAALLCTGDLVARVDIATGQDELLYDRASVASGRAATSDEWKLWALAEDHKYVEAREAAQKLARKEPDSFVAQLVLGIVQRDAEGNLAKGVFHLEQAMRFFAARYGRPSHDPKVDRWFATLIVELAWAHGEMEHHEEKLKLIAEYNKRFGDVIIGEQAWPLMKLGRFREARAMARKAIETELPGQRRTALNALCAIEFEAGNPYESYEACKEAVDVGREDPTSMDSVDLTNLAEAARSLFRFDEAESAALEASEGRVAWYGNPFVDLADLYLREGRFPEALDALKKAPAYRASRPAAVRDSDVNENKRVLASFFIAMGRADEANALTTQILTAPDRKSNNSRDAGQDEALAALLSRRTQRMMAELVSERATSRGWFARTRACFEALTLRLGAWNAGTRAAKLLSERERLTGIFKIGLHDGAISPPWLMGDLVDVMGAAVVEEALDTAARTDPRRDAKAYYDAFAAEALVARGDREPAAAKITSALAGLNPAETLLRARLFALRGQLLSDEGQHDQAFEAYRAAYEIDPGVFRRLEIELPATTRAQGTLAEDVVDGAVNSVRFTEESQGVRIEAQSSELSIHACVRDPAGTEWACITESREKNEADEDFVARSTSKLLAAVFAPRIDLSQGDMQSLDGSNQVTRTGVDDLRGVNAP